MKTDDLKELRLRLANLPKDNQALLAEFGQLCATKYIPELLRDAGLTKETPEFEENPCDMCFWAHQTVRIGCGHCSDKSEFVNMFSPDAQVRRAKYLSEIQDIKF